MTQPLSLGSEEQSREDELLAERTLRKVAWKLIPFLCLLYAFNILDRANVGFARKQMTRDLGLTQREFDLAYGLFYIGYLSFEVPSNLIMRRLGARLWIGRIMISWGLISCATLFVQGSTSFYAIRVLLGIAEAGFFPGIILYLGYWFPARDRARVTAFFMVAIAISSVFGNPLSGAIMHFYDGLWGLKDWQWLFLLEGIPSILLGFVVLFVMVDRPEDAKWLAAEERSWLSAKMRREEELRRETHGADHLRALLTMRVWLLIILYTPVAIAANASGAHLPRLVGQQFPELNTLQLGFVLAIPHFCAMVSMTLFSIHSDRRGERRLHFATSGVMSAVGWSLAALGTPLGLSPWVVFSGLCLAQAGVMAMLPLFWTIPSSFLTGAAAAGGIALINSVGNIGGFLGPNILGEYGLWAMAIPLYAGAVMAVSMRSIGARHT